MIFANNEEQLKREALCDSDEAGGHTFAAVQRIEFSMTFCR